MKRKNFVKFLDFSTVNGKKLTNNVVSYKENYVFIECSLMWYDMSTTKCQSKYIKFTAV